MTAEPMPTATASSATVRPTLRRRLATSQSPFARMARWAYRSINRFAVPAPKVLVLPVLWFCLWVRTIYFFCLRVFICEPFFKAVCKQYGRNVHTGTFVHWVGGKGDIILGDNVTLDGKISIKFAARFSDHPTLQIGDNTGIGHGCSFTIGKQITIGKNCNLSGSIEVMDSNAHRTDPTSRWKLEPPTPDEIRPVIIRDGVWIGQRCIIFPGVRIGEGSVIGAGSIVRSHVPAYSVVAGNPAKVMFRLKNPNQSSQAK